MWVLVVSKSLCGYVSNQVQYNMESAQYLWFGLVSLFNGISTLFKLFNAKAILLEEQ